MPERKPAHIEGFSLENILQIFSMERKSRTLMVSQGMQRGTLDIQEGELINAQTGEVEGIDAAKEILAWEDIRVELSELRECSRTIALPMMNVLMEAAQYRDEQQEAMHTPEELDLLPIIQNAELRNYNDAFRELTAYLQDNESNVLGWVWYSRLSGKLEVIRKALRKAENIDGNNEAFLEERKKLSVAIPTLRGEAIKKCLFCWSPLNKTDNRCPYCHGYQLVFGGSLNNVGGANKEILDAVYERYEALLAKNSDNILLCYALALIHLNYGDFKETLAYLDKVTRMAPDQEIFAKQLQLLLDHLAQASEKGEVAESEDAEGLRRIEQASSKTRDSGKKKILIVEDSSTTRKVIAITLTRNDYQVVEAADGLEALSKISEERPDLVMLDVILPKMDGYKILGIVKDNPEFKNIPVIMLTSRDGFINKMRGRVAGAAAYLTKPFNPEKMITEIKRHI